VNPDNQALIAAQYPALKKAFRTANASPAFDYGGRNKFRPALMKKRDEAKAKLKIILAGTSPAATTDIWTSKSGMSLTVSGKIANDSDVHPTHRRDLLL